MSHFAYTRPAGIWNTLTDLFAGEMSELDTKTYKAINGDEGGTWAPSSPIVVGGSGAQVKFFGVSSLPIGATLSAPGDITTTGFFNMNGYFEAAGQVEFLTGSSTTWYSGAAITLNAGTTLNLIGNADLSMGSGDATLGLGGFFQCSKTAVFNQVASFNGTTNFYGLTTAQSGFNVSGALVVSTTASFGGQVTTPGKISAGNIDTGTCVMAPCPRTYLMPNSNTTVDPTVYGSVFCQTITGSKVIQIVDSGSVPVGSEIEFVNLNTGWPLTVEDPLGNTIQELRNFAGLYFNAKAKKVPGGAWIFWSGSIA